MPVDRRKCRARDRRGERLVGIARSLPRDGGWKRGEFGMSARQVQTQVAVPDPRETSVLFGHRDAEAALLSAYRSGRIPHAWLIGGPKGIGKATLAYRMARFVLAHRDPLSPAVQRAA